MVFALPSHQCHFSFTEVDDNNIFIIKLAIKQLKMANNVKIIFS